MNLVDEPWIPCIWKNGAISRVSLLDCFKFGEDIADLAVRPHERVALMRLLLCIGYAAAGIPVDYDGWEGLKEKLPSAAAEYLEQWRESFELFHPDRPFLQIAGLSNAKDDGGLTACSKLDVALAAGNNSTIWDHAALTDRSFPPEKLALDLLTYQMFSLGGTIGPVIWNGRKTGRSSCDGPCAPGSMLHTFLRRESLLDTLHSNMLSEEELSDYKRMGDGWQGKPLWELFPRGLDDSIAVNNATQTFLGRMVPLTRAVRLSEDGVGMLLGDGLPFPSYTSPKRPFPPEVTATVVSVGENKRSLLGVQQGKSIWRQLAAISVMRHGDELGGCAALVHSCEFEDADLVVCGVARGQADVVDVVESVFHVPSAMFQAEGHELYEQEVAVAEKVASGLGIAVERYRHMVDGGWDLRLQQAGAKKSEVLAALKAIPYRYYWTAVETGLSLLWDMVRTCGSNDFLPAKKAWMLHLQKSANAAYKTACGTETERQMRAYSKGLRILKRSLCQCLELQDNGNKEDS